MKNKIRFLSISCQNIIIFLSFLLHYFVIKVSQFIALFCFILSENSTLLSRELTLLKVESLVLCLIYQGIAILLVGCIVCHFIAFLFPFLYAIICILLSFFCHFYIRYFALFFHLFIRFISFIFEISETL